MDQKILDELRRRTDLLIEHAEPNAITNGMSGSRMHFNMGLNILGGGSGLFELPEWWDEEYKKPIMDRDTFHSSTYDEYIGNLHSEAMVKVNRRKKKA